MFPVIVALGCLGVGPSLSPALLEASGQPQGKGAAPTSIRSPESFLVDESLTAQVMVLGVWHFDYPGLDVHKTAEEDRVDVLAPERQKEMHAVADALAAFVPTKICLEARDPAGIQRLFEEYKAGEHERERDERYQLGFRLAKQLGHARIHAVDCDSISNELASDEKFKPWVEGLWETSRRDLDVHVDPYEARYSEWYAYGDRLVRELSIGDALLRMNGDDALRYSHGAYLTELSRVQSDAGADLLSVWWMNRNLRLFARIARVKEPGDRLLVIIGAGHVPILKQCFESSPEFVWVPVARYLGGIAGRSAR